MSAWGPHKRAGVGTIRASTVRAVHAHPVGVHGPGGCVRGDPAGTHTGRRGDLVGMGVWGSSGHRWACVGIQQAWACGDSAGMDVRAWGSTGHGRPAGMGVR